MSGFWSLYFDDVLATIWLFFCWTGYARFSRIKARSTFCISSVLHNYRKRWMERMLYRDNRVSDASLLANLERNSSFLASTSMLVIAGLVTALASVDKVYSVIVDIPFTYSDITPFQLQFKIVLLLFIYIYSFFTFSWSMRQYGFCAVLLGAAPIIEGESISSAQQLYIESTAKVMDQAGHSYNYGLRAYYFSLAVLSWLLSAWLFMVAVLFVVIILYRREFHSRSLRAMSRAGGLTIEDIKSNVKSAVD